MLYRLFDCLVIGFAIFAVFFFLGGHKLFAALLALVILVIAWNDYFKRRN